MSKQELQMRTMDKKVLQKSGAVGIPKVEKRQPTKIIGFSLSGRPSTSAAKNLKRKQEENSIAEPKSKVFKTIQRPTIQKAPLKEVSKNTPRVPLTKSAAVTKVAPKKVEPKSTPAPTPRSNEKNISSLSIIQLRKLATEQQQKLKTFEEKIKKLEESIKEKDMIIAKETVSNEQVDEVKAVVNVEIIPETIQEDKEKKIDEFIAETVNVETERRVDDFIQELVKENKVESVIEVKEIESIVEEVKEESVEFSHQEEEEEIKNDQQTEEMVDAFIQETVEPEIEESQSTTEKETDQGVETLLNDEELKDLEDSVIEEKEESTEDKNETKKFDSPIQEKNFEMSEDESNVEEQTTKELSKVLNFDECKDEDESISVGEIVKKTPIRKRNLRKKRKSLDVDKLQEELNELE
jgi:hypothetical protein